MNIIESIENRRSAKHFAPNDTMPENDLNAHKNDPARYSTHAPTKVQDILVPALTPVYAGKSQITREGIVPTALAEMTLMLAAVRLGYESCPMVGFDAEVVILDRF